jgi:K(+)-stimulated pyrophosphate-energized sodium pump
MDISTFPFLIGILAVLVVVYLTTVVLRESVGTPRMTQIADYIRIGTKAYLGRQFRTIAWFMPALALLMSYFLGWKTAVTFIFGALLSLLVAYIGMNVAVRANVRTANAARKSSSRALRIAFMGGGVMGLCVTGLSLIGLYLLYLVFKGELEPLIGFGFGASLAAIFAQIGGGIYTKAADIGADLVGKVELGIPEDDPRNPAVIADLVGDNVGDCAGRGSDLFQSFSGDIITGMILGFAFISKYGANAVIFPFMLQAVGVLASIVGIFLVRGWKGRSPSASLNLGLCVTAVLCAIGSYFISMWLLNDVTIFYSALSGLIAMIVGLFVARYYTGITGKPVRKMAESSQRGAAINIMTGMAYGFQSSIIPILAVMCAVSFSFFISGYSLYAIVAANIGTDLMIGFIMASDTFGPIVDNANGIAELSGISDMGETLGSLDAVGNTMKACTKAYGMASGTVTAFVLFATFFQITGIKGLNVTQPFDLAAFFIGVALPFFLSSFTIGSTAKTALLMVDEVRRQFRENKGLMNGNATPDYAKCIDVSTKNAIKEMMLPGFVAVAMPITAGVLFGSEVLGALLIGITASAAVLAPFFNNVGAAFDNAKKIIENGLFGGKGSETEKAAIVGDAVGDSFKDVAGPSLLIFMKLVGMTALLLAPIL